MPPAVPPHAALGAVPAVPEMGPHPCGLWPFLCHGPAPHPQVSFWVTGDVSGIWVVLPTSCSNRHHLAPARVGHGCRTHMFLVPCHIADRRPLRPSPIVCMRCTATSSWLEAAEPIWNDGLLGPSKQRESPAVMAVSSLSPLHVKRSGRGSSAASPSCGSLFRPG